MRILFVALACLFILALSVEAKPTTSGLESAQPAANNLLLMAPLAFLAGILSFLSPCTLPLLPAYFAFTFQSGKREIAAMTVSFFLGLATIFVLLGASATLLGSLLRANLPLLVTLGGLAIIAFGVMTILGKGFQGFQFQNEPAATPGGSYLFGATFALGWTACIGPILGSLLVLAGTTETVYGGMVLLFIYAMGLGLPLILVSTFLGRADRESLVWRLLRGKGWNLRLAGQEIHLHTTNLISGGLLVGLGLLMATGNLTLLNGYLPISFQLWFLEIEKWLLGTFSP